MTNMAETRSKQTHDLANNFVKEPFNKKKWRNEKYSTKLKVQKYQEKRKTILRKKLNKELSKEGINLPHKQPESKKKNSRIKEAQIQYEKKKEDQRNAAIRDQKIKTEKMKKIQENRAKKLEKLRILNQKTRKGQPVMKGRLELLQQKIEKLVAENRL